MLTILTATLQQSLLFVPLTLGMYISYRIMLVTDLTVEATFVMGAAVFAKLITGDCNQTVAFILALLSGGLAGIGVAVMQRVAKIDSLIASVLAIFMLYSINFKIMGMPNISLLNVPTLIQNLQYSHPTALFVYIAIFVVCIGIAFCAFLHSKPGLYLRAYGNNQALLSRLGHKTSVFLIIGLMVSNMLAALSGVLTAQINGYADLSMGTGMALTAIGALIIGLKITRRKSETFNAYYDFFGSFVGIFVYFFLLNGLLYIGVDPVYLKFLLGIILVFFLSSVKKTKGEVYAACTT